MCGRLSTGTLYAYLKSFKYFVNLNHFFVKNFLVDLKPSRSLDHNSGCDKNFIRKSEPVY